MKLSGIIPPIPTPFDAEGGLDLDGLRAVIERLDPDVDGFLVLGSNGEASYLDEGERSQVLSVAREAVPKSKPMLAGTGGEATRLVIERNRVAARTGADAVLVLPPCYYRAQMSDGALEAHYRAVADASSLPVMLYNIPQATTLSLSPELIARLARHPNISGLKDSSGNVGALTEIIRLVPEEFVVMTGNAPTLLPSLSLGAAGGILAVANVAPKPYRELWQAFERLELQTAARLQLAYNPIALAVTNVYGVPGLKAAMRLGGVPAGYPRSPLQDVDGRAESDLAELLKTLELLEPRDTAAPR